MGFFVVDKTFSIWVSIKGGEMETRLGVLFFYFFEVYFIALAGVAQWIEYPPENQRVADLIPSQDTCLGC